MSWQLHLACETRMILMAMARGVELNVHHTGKRVRGRLRQPRKNNDGWDQQTRLRCSFNKLMVGKAGGAGI